MEALALGFLIVLGVDRMISWCRLVGHDYRWKRGEFAWWLVCHRCNDIKSVTQPRFNGRH